MKTVSGIAVIDWTAALPDSYAGPEEEAAVRALLEHIPPAATIHLWGLDAPPIELWVSLSRESVQVDSEDLAPTPSDGVPTIPDNPILPEK